MMEALLLNLWASPFGMSCAIALREKGVQFLVQEEDIPYHKSQLLLDSNPVFKEVPVLIHHGKPVYQSQVILEYIEEAWPAPPSLLPADPYLRAVARFWSRFANLQFIETGLKLMKKVGEEHELAREQIIEYFLLFEKALCDYSNEGPFLFGKILSLPDISMASLVCWYNTYESLGELKFPDAKECPKVHAWLSAMKELDSVKSTVPDDDKLLKHCTSFRQDVLNAATKEIHQ